MKQPVFTEWIDPALAAERQHAEIAKITGVGNGRMLELFSGDARYLKYFQDKGWECLGLETDERLADTAMLENAVPTLSGEPGEVALPADSYDIVRIRGALSTHGDPEALLDLAFRCAAPTGYLVAETWNGSGAPVSRERAAITRRFNRRTLADLIRKPGFEVGGVIAPRLGDPVWSPLRKDREGGERPIPWGIFRAADAVLGFFDRGSMLVAFAQKPPHSAAS